MVVTRVDLIWFMVVLRFSTLMIHYDSVHAMQLFLISAQQSWFIGFIVPLGEHNQTLHCTRRIRKRYLGFHKILKPVICHAWKHKNPSVKRSILCEPTFWLLLRRWKMPMHTLRTGLYALVHSGFCRVFFWICLTGEHETVCGKARPVGCDLICFSTQIHWFTWESLKDITPQQASPKSDPLGWGASNLVMGLGWFHKAFDINIAQTKVGAFYIILYWKLYWMALKISFKSLKQWLNQWQSSFSCSRSQDETESHLRHVKCQFPPLSAWWAAHFLQHLAEQIPHEGENQLIRFD